jgi:hypothetical protein
VKTKIEGSVSTFLVVTEEIHESFSQDSGYPGLELRTAEAILLAPGCFTISFV